MVREGRRESYCHVIVVDNNTITVRQRFLNSCVRDFLESLMRGMESRKIPMYIFHPNFAFKSPEVCLERHQASGHQGKRPGRKAAMELSLFMHHSVFYFVLFQFNFQWDYSPGP